VDLGLHTHVDARPNRPSVRAGVRFDYGSLNQPYEVQVYPGRKDRIDSPHQLDAETETTKWLRQVLERMN